MPFYEYQCKNCGHELEAMQKISDSPLKKCPHCGKSQLQRLISAPVFRLKGGGWYETDFKDDKDKKRNLAEGGDSEPEKKQAETKSEKATDSKASPDSKADQSSSNDNGESKKAQPAGADKTGPVVAKSRSKGSINRRKKVKPAKGRGKKS